MYDYVYIAHVTNIKYNICDELKKNLEEYAWTLKDEEFNLYFLQQYPISTYTCLNSEFVVASVHCHLNVLSISALLF